MRAALYPVSLSQHNTAGHAAGLQNVTETQDAINKLLADMMV